MYIFYRNRFLDCHLLICWWIASYSSISRLPFWAAKFCNENSSSAWIWLIFFEWWLWIAIVLAVIEYPFTALTTKSNASFLWHPYRYLRLLPFLLSFSFIGHLSIYLLIYLCKIFALMKVEFSNDWILRWWTSIRTSSSY